MNIKGNQHFKETDQRIQDVMMALLEEKDVRKITVREVCAAAGINRSTFYAHYLDIYDLMDKMNQALSRKITQHSIALMGSSEQFYAEPYSFFFLEHIQEYRVFYRAWLCLHHEIVFQLGKTNLLDHLAQKRFALGGVTGELEQLYFSAYYKAGMNSIIHLWLERGCQEDADTIRELMKRCYPHQKHPKGTTLPS